MRSAVLFGLASLLLTACGPKDSPPPVTEQRDDKVLLNAVKAPLEKAASVEQTLQAQKDARDQALDNELTTQP